MAKETKNQPKIGDKKTVNGTNYICKGFTETGKPMWRKDEIEKAHQVGDAHPSKPWVWTEYKPGKFDWRPAKKNKSTDSGAATGGGSFAAATSKTETKQVGGTAQQAAQQSAQQAQPNKKIEDMTPDELIDYAKNASTDALSKVVNDNKADKQLRQLAFNELKTRKDYDKTKVSSSDLEGGYIAKPKPTIQYKTKKPDIEIPEPEDYMATSKTGEIKPQRISTIRKLFAKRTNDELLNTLNNRNAKWQLRQVAYDEAAHRGIPEDKINVKGTLQLQWKKEKEKKEIEENMNKEINEDEAISLSYDWKGLDHKKILDEDFDGGLDTSWLDPNSDRVKKIFRTETLSGRQKYDTFKDYYQRDPKLVPGYLNAKNKVNNLYGQMLNWAKADNSPMFISAGGAGAGKTFGWQEIAKYLSLPELEPGSDDNISNQDWGYVMLTDKAAEDPDSFNKTLAKYNGTWIDDQGNERPHILFFDDADKLLISKSPALMAILKKINDNNPNNRIFHNPDTGKDEIWRGKIIVTTNKDIGVLSKSEDFKAIQSRVTVNEIKFTRNETMEILADRYMKMKLPDECTKAFEEDSYTEEEIEDFRQDMFDFMQEHIQDADPNKFTPRAFIKLCQDVAPVWKSGSKVINTGTIQAGTDLHWRKTALEILKAEENDIEKSEEDSLYSRDAMLETKSELERTMAEAKKNGSYEKLFGENAQNLVLFGEGSEENSSDKDKKKNKKKSKKSEKKEPTEDEAKKAFDDDMTLDEAESILLS